MARRDGDLAKLHPAFRHRIEQILGQLASESIPLRVFEAFRAPERQNELYAKGRTQPGAKVTNAAAWSSYHQYGVAVDFVAFLDGNWSWDTSAGRGRWWTRMHEIGRSMGLEPLSFELPHLQLAGLTLSQLRSGQYPSGGDASWAENLTDAINGWHGPQATPPVPGAFHDRPPLDGGSGPTGVVATTGPPATNGSALYRVTARSGLRLRGGPGTSFEVIGSLRAGQLVHRVGVQGYWFKIDLHGDGLSDGFAHGAFFELAS